MTSRHRDRGRMRRRSSTALTADELLGDVRHPLPARKLGQLCAEVARALTWVWETEIHDPLLEELYLLEVRPNPDGGRLLALFAAPPGHDLARSTDRLAHAAALLRDELAHSLCRKRLPQLSFAVVPWEVSHD